ncbi:unnamed protein product, partial [Aureobasidium mustum]
MPGTSSPVSLGSSEPPMSFQFVNLTDPSDTKDQKVRRAIRSHVTKQQHQRAEQLAAARRSNSDPQLLGTSSAQIPQGRAHSASYPVSRPTSSDQHSPISPTSSSDVSSFSSTPQYPMIDVSQVYPAQWLPYLNQILENYMAIQAMNGNLSTKDSMIATMATMAQYEAFWRDADAFSTHMSGLRQFVEMRGGLSALGLDGFLERMLVAIDLDLARTTGHERLFASSRQFLRRQGSDG